MSRRFPSVSSLKKRDNKLFVSQSKRRAFPTIGPNDEKLQVVYGGVSMALFCMKLLQEENQTWEDVVRIVGSGVMSVLKIKDVNILGSQGSVKTMNTVQRPAPGETIEPEFDTGFEGFRKLGIQELVELQRVEESEIGAFWGVLMRVFVTSPNEGGDLKAFVDNRISNATKACMKPPRVFVQNTSWITYPILRKVEAAFHNNPTGRENMIKNIVLNLDKPRSGMQIAFYNMFEMLENSGMTAYAIVKEALSKGEEVLVRFPELYKELEYVEDVVSRLLEINDLMLPYIKLASGDRFVPGDQNEFKSLLVVCKEIVTRFRPTMRSYTIKDASEALEDKAKAVVVEIFGEDVKHEEDEVVVVE